MNKDYKQFGIAFMALIFLWSAWYWNNFSPTLPIDKSPVGYMECWNDDGTGPYTKDCGDMNIKCWSERNGHRVDCPFFENTI